MASSRGLSIDIEHIEGLLEGLAIGRKELPGLLRETLVGEGGRAILRWNRRLIHSRTGATLSHLGIRGGGVNAGGDPENVEVGYEGPLVENGSVQGARLNVGTWLESGTRMHRIVPFNRKALSYRGRVVESSVSPGTKPQRIMSKSLKAVTPEFETALVVMAGALANRMHFTGSEEA